MKVIEKFPALLPCIQRVHQHLGSIPHKTIVVDIDDTLIFDDARSTANVQVKELIKLLKERNYAIHLVTARLHDAENLRITKQELKKSGIEYTTLKLAPAKARDSVAGVAAWKHEQRAKVKPVALTVGDQWTDLVKVASDEDLLRLDHAHGVHLTPWVLVDPEDGVSALGLKLMA